MAAIDKLLEAAVKNQVELVLLEPGRLPRFRRAGTELEVTHTLLDATAIERLLAEIAPGGQAPSPQLEPRFEFDHAVGRTVFHFAGLAGAAGWSVSASPKPGTPRPATAPAAAGEKSRRPLPAADALLRSMVDLDASDLHLAAWQVPRLRIHGELTALELFEPPTSARLKELLYEIAPERAREEFEARGFARFAHEIPDFARFRVCLLRDHQGVGAAIRHVPLAVPTADQLDLPEPVRIFALAPRGLVLLAGPPGSGRSSTLAALVALAAARPGRLVVTVERPIEHLLVAERSLVRQIEVIAHAASTREAVEATAGAGADVVALADASEPAALAAAIARAEAGALVFAVVDADGVGPAIERALEALGAGGAPRATERLARALRGVVAQKLVRRAGGGGRIAVWEIAPAAPPIVSAVAEGDLWRLPAALAAAHDAGARSEVEALADLVAFRAIEPGDAARAACDRAALVERLRALEPSGALAAQVESFR